MNATKPLRLWPGVAAAVALLLARFALPVALPDTPIFGMETAIIGLLGWVVGALAIVAWWVFFSRAAWTERVSALVVMAVALLATRSLVHPSIAGAGQGYLLYLLAIPVMCVALVASAVATRRLGHGARLASMAAAILLACGAFALIRSDGITSSLLGSDYRWRWTPTAEERLLAQAPGETPEPARSAATPLASPAPVESATGPLTPATVPATTPAKTAASAPSTPAVKETATGPAMSERTLPQERERPRVEWPGFRGPARDGVIRGVRIDTDWSASPPVQLWRRPIGPGWSSFAVSGDLVYTQEQRGDDEIVACYSLTTGKPVWMHRDAARFWESNGGAGPRGTPTLGHGRVYAFGATGTLNALDAGTGQVVWSRNASSDTGVKIPGWGFTSSPLVHDDLVIVAVSGALVAYDAATGTQRWFRKSNGGSYSSPHLLTLGGIAQVLLLGGAGAISVAPADGAVLWQNTWAGGPMVQPALLAGGDVLLTTADAMGGLGTRRVAVGHGSTGWTVEERWTSRGLKPYFSDYVVHQGHAYGFDGSILAAIDLETGERKWKGGRYGNGQLVLLAEQDLLLVISEEGELALVSATPDQFREVARFPVLNAKTWNHPVLVGDVLLVRNGEEMAAFRLSLASRERDTATGGDRR